MKRRKDQKAAAILACVATIETAVAEATADPNRNFTEKERGVWMRLSHGDLQHAESFMARHDSEQYRRVSDALNDAWAIRDAQSVAERAAESWRKWQERRAEGDQAAALDAGAYFLSWEYVRTTGQHHAWLKPWLAHRIGATLEEARAQLQSDVDHYVAELVELAPQDAKAFRALERLLRSRGTVKQLAEHLKDLEMTPAWPAEWDHWVIRHEGPDLKPDRFVHTPWGKDPDQFRAWVVRVLDDRDYYGAKKLLVFADNWRRLSPRFYHQALTDALHTELIRLVKQTERPEGTL